MDGTIDDFDIPLSNGNTEKVIKARTKSNSQSVVAEIMY